jgi:heme/copper-type cytochrome/quinol oxidase subunit 1
MTVTEAPRDVLDTDAAVAADTEPAPPTGLAALVGSGDPRTVGKLFVGTSLLFLLVSGVAGLLVGFELVDLDKTDNILGNDVFAQVVTLHSVTGLFLVVLPLLLGLATAVVPLQVGASTVAFPRASAAAYWTYLVSGGLILAAYAINGGPFGGDDSGVAMFIAAFVVLLAALCVATVSVVTTVLTLRAPGMTLRRTPLFSWSMVVGGSIWLLTLPMLAGGLVLAYLDFTYGQQFLGGAEGVYGRIEWAFWQPTLYAFAIPALGIVADIVPVFAQRRLKQHAVAMGMIGLFGALSFGAWAQAGVALVPDAPVRPWVDGSPWLLTPWVAASFVVVLPLLALLGLFGSTLGAGRVKLGSPVIFAQGAVLLLLAGVAAGVLTVIKDLDLAGTTWMTAQSYTVLLGTIVAALGGVAFWAPKLYGRLLPEAAGRLVATVLVLGTLVLAVPYAIAGFLDEPRPLEAAAATDLSDKSTVEILNLIAAIGGAVVVLGIVLAVLTLLRTAFSSVSTSAEGAGGPGDDPWAGHTLEWTTSSPPPVGNFAGLLEVTSEAPLYDARHAAERATTEASA